MRVHIFGNLAFALLAILLSTRSNATQRHAQQASNGKAYWAALIKRGLQHLPSAPVDLPSAQMRALFTPLTPAELSMLKEAGFRYHDAELRQTHPHLPGRYQIPLAYEQKEGGGIRVFALQGTRTTGYQTMWVHLGQGRSNATPTPQAIHSQQASNGNSNWGALIRRGLQHLPSAPVDLPSAQMRALFTPLTSAELSMLKEAGFRYYDAELRQTHPHLPGRYQIPLAYEQKEGGGIRVFALQGTRKTGYQTLWVHLGQGLNP